jgi:hypothetical protein
LIWQVASDGMPIGRAELVTREHEIESTFTTDGLASMFASVHHDLVTPIDLDARVHSIHSALAWLRAWVPRDPAPAVLDVVFDDDHYKLTCEPPIADELHGRRANRIACEIADGHQSIGLTFWLSADDDRLPLAVVARAGSFHLGAELVAH